MWIFKKRFQVLFNKNSFIFINIFEGLRDKELRIFKNISFKDFLQNNVDLNKFFKKYLSRPSWPKNVDLKKGFSSTFWQKIVDIYKYFQKIFKTVKDLVAKNRGFLKNIFPRTFWPRFRNFKKYFSTTFW